MKKYTTLLIDDEKLALSRLQQLLNTFPDVFEIIGVAGNGEEGSQLVDELKPDLLFLDIEMPAMNGFQMLKKVQHIPIIVFVTAFDEYAVRAFEENSIDYLLKPVERERLALTVQKLKTIKPLDNHTIQLLQLIESFKSEKKELQSIPIKVGDQYLLIRTEEIAYMEAENKFVYVYTIAGAKHLLDQTITALTEKLPDYFLRISRSSIVNKFHIRKIEKDYNGRYQLVLNDKTGTKIMSGVHYSDNVKRMISI